MEHLARAPGEEGDDVVQYNKMRLEWEIRQLESKRGRREMEEGMPGSSEELVTRFLKKSNYYCDLLVSLMH